MKNKELILDAIDNYTVYPPRARHLLKLLVNLSIDNVIKADVKELMALNNKTVKESMDLNNQTNLKESSIPTIYKYLRFFEKDGVIEFLTDKQRGFNHFRINTIQLEEILEVYLKKKNLVSK